MRIVRYAATLSFLASAYAAEPARIFRQQDYPPSSFRVSERVIEHGSVRIHIAQARKIKHDKRPPHLCRAWLSVAGRDGVVFQRYFDDIDAVGFSFGLFVPGVQPGKRFVAVVKLGDYDGRLYLIRDDGKTADLDGGFYFVTEDGRFIVSEYASDEKRVTIFSLEEERVVFALKDAADIMQWYTKDGGWFFTERLGVDWPPREGRDVVTLVDFAKNNSARKRATPGLFDGARKVPWAFDPRKQRDCH